MNDVITVYFIGFGVTLFVLLTLSIYNAEDGLDIAGNMMVSLLLASVWPAFLAAFLAKMLFKRSQ